ncbi:MAG: VCBS domain-containing protein [Eubacterium ramulus]
MLNPRNQLLQKRQYLTDQEEALERLKHAGTDSPGETAQTGNVCGETGRSFAIKKIEGRYAFLADSDGKRVQQAAEAASEGDYFTAHMLDGTIEAEVHQIKKKE